MQPLLYRISVLESYELECRHKEKNSYTFQSFWPIMKSVLIVQILRKFEFGETKRYKLTT